MWKLVTEVDISTGQGQKGFRYEEVSPDGTLMREFVIPEDVALLLMKELIQGFPSVVEGLINEVNAETQVHQPPPQQFAQQPQMVQPQDEPLTPQIPQRMPPPVQQAEVPSTPLELPSRQGPTTLSDLAPRVSGERDAPQG